MTFEELFPSLKPNENFWQAGIRHYDWEQIEEHCLDKQRVREVFERFLATTYYFHPETVEEAVEQHLANVQKTNEALRVLRKELGL